MPQHTPNPTFRRTLGRAVVTTSVAALAALLPATPAFAAPADGSAAVVTPVALTTTTIDPTGAVLADHVQAQRASSALQLALSKIGKPYKWGAAGPNAFDCSGLVSWAYKQVGVSLPRTSAAQARVGKPVAKSDLRPGDLVFFYKPISHVAIYIGNGKVVHASTSGQPVKISDLNRMPFTTARRV